MDGKGKGKEIWCVNMKELFEALGHTLISLLPHSPFAEIYATFTVPQWVGWLNWFIPVGAILKVMAAWLAAIALHYVYSVVSRWIGLIS